MRTTKIKPLIVLGTVALLALTGCASGSDEPTGNGAPAGAEPQARLFEFQTSTYGSDNGELAIRIPAELSDATGAADELLVTEVQATARELSGAKYCAVDLAVSYAGDAPDVLTEPSMTKAEWQESAEEAFLAAAGAEIKTMEQAEQTIALGDVEGARLQELKEGFLDKSYEPTPGWSLLSEARPAAELDSSAPKHGVYFSDDYKTLTFVENCAVSPVDDGDATFRFPKLDQKGKVVTLAEVELSVMKSGTITVTSANVPGFTQDTDGNWIAK
ncbi:hypothetical protein ACFUCV_09455 [Specibacter sp. NPDC057265]|uniref:hypothetical protein n=1 Tax=Specibacter sp. NPDC057265 TaxID=3346075 RepID=UPI0036390EBA